MYLIHLVERNHDEKFVALMDRYMPMWRVVRTTLNEQTLDYMEKEQPKGGLTVNEGSRMQIRTTRTMMRSAVWKSSISGWTWRTIHSKKLYHNPKTLSQNAKKLSRKIQYLDFKTIVCQMFHYNFWSSAYYRECSDIFKFA